MSYSNRVQTLLQKGYPHEPEYLQATSEVLESIDKVVTASPYMEEAALLERLVEPERIIQFRVSWRDASGKIQVNRGWRVEFNSALGPYKGGLRFHPQLNLSILKFLGFEQTLKNALTGLPMGGAKGGADFDPKGKSDADIMSFCQSYMCELYRHIGPNTDVPAGDIGVGSREIGYLFGQYKRLTNQWSGAMTGKGLSYGGSHLRKEATGYGVLYFAQLVSEAYFDEGLAGKRMCISGSGNVGIYTAQKAQEQGVSVVAMSDSSGWIFDPDGVDVEAIKKLKEQDHESLARYQRVRPGSQYFEASGPWEIPCDIYVPCATQNELDDSACAILTANGVSMVVEGANMPLTQSATRYLRGKGVCICPSKAANAGGVGVSGLEMSQNAGHIQWSEAEVDARLRQIMGQVFESADRAATDYGRDRDLIAGANIAGFLKVADAMRSQGVV